MRKDNHNSGQGALGNKAPLVSLIIPVYGVEKYLDQCMESVLAQTYRQLEIILVDDGSPDACGAICDSYAARDPRVRVIHQENAGLSAARNAGLDICRGEWIAFLDSDDWMAEKAVETLLKAALDAGAQIAVCGLRKEYVRAPLMSPKSKKPRKRVVFQGEQVIWALSEGWFENFAWNKIYRRELFETVRFPVGRNHEDIATVYKNMLLAERVVLIPDELFYYRQRKSSISKSRSVRDLTNLWQAEQERYQALIPLNPAHDRFLLQQNILAITYFYCWFSACTREEKKGAGETLAQMHDFAVRHYQRIMRGHQPPAIKLYCLALQRRGRGHLRFLYQLNLLRRRFLFAFYEMYP